MHTRVEIKKNDQVKVITGRDKGKQGRVLHVFPGDNKILVEHVAMVKKAVKAQPGKTKGGIAEQESRIALSNVMIVCPSCNKPARVAHKEKGERFIRACARCESPLDK